MEEIRAKSSAAEALIEELMEENEVLKREMRQMVDEMDELQDNFRWVGARWLDAATCRTSVLRLDWRVVCRRPALGSGKTRWTSTATWKRNWNRRQKTAASCSSNCAKRSGAASSSRTTNTTWRSRSRTWVPRRPPHRPPSRRRRRRPAWTASTNSNRNWSWPATSCSRRRRSFRVCRRWPSPRTRPPRTPDLFSAKAAVSRYWLLGARARSRSSRAPTHSTVETATCLEGSRPQKSWTSLTDQDRWWNGNERTGNERQPLVQVDRGRFARQTWPAGLSGTRGRRARAAQVRRGGGPVAAQEAEPRRGGERVSGDAAEKDGHEEG